MPGRSHRGTRLGDGSAQEDIHLAFLARFWHLERASWNGVNRRLTAFCGSFAPDRNGPAMAARLVYPRLGLLVIAITLVMCGPAEAPGPIRSVYGGSVDQNQRLEEAIARFEAADLELPVLAVAFSPNRGDCEGHDGLFDSRITPWRVTICSTAAYVYEHELAHAWERANLSDEQRQAYMAFRGLASWAESHHSRMERGVEDAAFVIQQGLSVGLPSKLDEERRSRLAAYELLTGRPAPVLVRWREERGGGVAGDG